MSVDRQALVGFIAEIEASRARAKGESRHQSEIFKKAREKNLDPKAMRKVLQRRAMSKTDRENLDEAVDLYEHALGALAKAVEAVRDGMSAREAAEKFSVPRAALGHLARGSKNAISDPPHDPETGEVVETLSATIGAAFTHFNMTDNAPAGKRVAEKSCGGTLSDRASETLEATVSEGDVAPASSAKGTDGSATSDAGTPSGDFAEPAVTDVASRCEPGPQDLTPGCALDAAESARPAPAPVDPLQTMSADQLWERVGPPPLDRRRA